MLPYSATGSTRRTLVWLAGVAVALLLLSMLVPLYGFWVVDNGTKYLQMLSIAEKHRFTDFSIANPLPNDDPELQLKFTQTFQVFMRGGKMYAIYPPAFAYTAALLRVAAGDTAIRILPLLGALGVLWFCAQIAYHLRLPCPRIAASLVLFASPLLPYAFTFWETLPSLAFMLGALYYAMRAREASEHGERRTCLRAASVAALYTAGAILLREQYLVWGGSIFAALLLTRGGRRAGVAYAGTLTACVGVIAAVNYRMIGAPLFMMVWSRGGDAWMSFDWSTRLLTLERFFTYIATSYRIENRLLDIVMFAGVASLVFLPRVRGIWPIIIVSMALLFTALIRDFWWFSPKLLTTQIKINSLASCTPIVFLGFAWRAGRELGDSQSKERNPDMILLVVSGVLFLAITAFTSPLVSAIGANFGPRILLPVYAIFGIRAWRCTSDILSQPRSSTRRVVIAMVALLALVGVADNAVFMHRLRVKTRLFADIMQMIRTAAPRPVLTNVQWLDLEMAPLYYTRPMLFLGNETRVPEAVAVSRKLNSDSALVITYGEPYAALTSFGELRPYGPAANLKFPDSLYSFQTHELRYNP